MRRTASLLFFVAAVAVVLAGCSNAVKSTLSRGFAAARPYALVVLPVQAAPGVTLDEKAAKILRNATVERLRTMDYAVRGLEETDSKLAPEVSPAEAASLLGADAVVSVTVTKWDASLLVSYASLSFAARFRMHAGDGAVIWEAEHGAREADLMLDKGQLELSILKAYEPTLERFVDMVLYTLPKGEPPRTPGRHFDWLP